jgi:hypothetical protein
MTMTPLRGDQVFGHIGGCTLGARDTDSVSCACPQGVHEITGHDPAEVIRQVAWHCGWQGDPNRLVALATTAGDVRPALADLLSPHR